MSEFENTKEQLLRSDDFVLSECMKIQYGYTLKKTIRYAVDREEDMQTESVAEHVYALHLLADYFFPLEDSTGTLDRHKIHDMLQYHDIDEIETGDTIGYLKTAADRAREAEATERVVANFPAHMHEYLRKITEEYDAQNTTEARFAKAIDRVEPLFQLYSEEGKRVMHLQRTTKIQHDGLKVDYLRPFPTMFRFYEVITQRMVDEGYFTSAE